MGYLGRSGGKKNTVSTNISGLYNVFIFILFYFIFLFYFIYLFFFLFFFFFFGGGGWGRQITASFTCGKNRCKC